jgi:alpha-beta hydrolase superfamily lysophospholipase
MREVVFSYRASDGRELFYRTWPGTAGVEDKPCLILIHGIESHSGWYNEAGEKLAGSGLEVYALDRRGSGLNKEARGDLADFHKLSRDIDDFFLQKELAKRKCILMGLCWGAKTALHFSLCNPEKVSGIIFITPGFKTKLHMSFSKKINWLGALLFAPHKFLKLPIAPEMFTEDRIYLNRIKEDNLRLKAVTSRFFKENLRLEKAIKKHGAKLDTPCLLLLAEE